VRREFAKYFVIGCSAFLLDITTLFLFKEYLRLTPVEAVILNQALLLNYVFLMNKYWSFKAKGPTRAQIVRFYSVAAMNYGISVAWIWFFTVHFHLVIFHPEKYNYLAFRAANIVLAVAWNFLLYKFWVYADRSVRANHVDGNDTNTLHVHN
jgi:putative flippase GtrA